MKKVGIIGCGWLGSRLAQFLSSEYQLYSTTRSSEKARQLNQLGYQTSLVDFSKSVANPWEVINRLDVLVVTLPFSKRKSIEELHHQFLELNTYISSFNKQLFFTSSTGIYPNQQGIYDETHTNDLNTQLEFVEQLFVSHFPQVNRLRLGGLMGDSRQLRNYLPLTNLKQTVNHVHYQDVCQIIRQMIQQKSTQALYNIVAPEHPTKQEIIDSQFNNSNKVPVRTETVQRIILSTKVREELKFTFQFPNPIFF